MPPSKIVIPQFQRFVPSGLGVHTINAILTSAGETAPHLLIEKYNPVHFKPTFVDGRLQVEIVAPLRQSMSYLGLLFDGPSDTIPSFREYSEYQRGLTADQRVTPQHTAPSKGGKITDLVQALVGVNLVTPRVAHLRSLFSFEPLQPDETRIPFAARIAGIQQLYAGDIGVNDTATTNPADTPHDILDSLLSDQGMIAGNILGLNSLLATLSISSRRSATIRTWAMARGIREAVYTALQKQITWIDFFRSDRRPRVSQGVGALAEFAQWLSVMTVHNHEGIELFNVARDLFLEEGRTPHALDAQKLKQAAMALGQFDTLFELAKDQFDPVVQAYFDLHQPSQASAYLAKFFHEGEDYNILVHEALLNRNDSELVESYLGRRLIGMPLLSLVDQFVDHPLSDNAASKKMAEYLAKRYIQADEDMPHSDQIAKKLYLSVLPVLLENQQYELALQMAAHMPFKLHQFSSYAAIASQYVAQGNLQGALEIVANARDKIEHSGPNDSRLKPVWLEQLNQVELSARATDSAEYAAVVKRAFHPLAVAGLHNIIEIVADIFRRRQPLNERDESILHFLTENHATDLNPLRLYRLLAANGQKNKGIKFLSNRQFLIQPIPEIAHNRDNYLIAVLESGDAGLLETVQSQLKADPIGQLSVIQNISAWQQAQLMSNWAMGIRAGMGSLPLSSMVAIPL